MTEVDGERQRRFDALFRENVAGIASYCGWRSRSSGDEQDAVAEVFLVAWRRLDAVPEGEGARPWLYTTARRVLANQARANARRGRLNERLGAQPGAIEAEEDSLAGQVHEALSVLGPRDREVLLLAEWEGLTPAEIARVMRCPAVTARGRLHRARRRFRVAYEESQAQSDAPGSRRELPGGGTAHVAEPSGQIASQRRPAENGLEQTERRSPRCEGPIPEGEHPCHPARVSRNCGGPIPVISPDTRS